MQSNPYHVIFEPCDQGWRAVVAGMRLCRAERETLEEARSAIHDRLALQIGGLEQWGRARISESFAPRPSLAMRILRRILH